MIAAITITKPGQPNTQKSGTINDKGQWIIPPIYPEIYQHKIGNYLRARNENEKIGLIDSVGNVVLPLEYDYISHFKDELFLCSTGDKNNRNGKIIDVSSGKIIQDNLPFIKIRTFNTCDDKFYSSQLNGGDRQLVNKNFKPVSDKFDFIFTENENIETIIHAKPNKITTRYDCDHNIVPIEINGEKIEKYNNIRRINDELDLYTLLDDRQFLVSKNNNAIPMEQKVKTLEKANLGTLYKPRGGGRVHRGKGTKELIGIIDIHTGKVVLPFVFSIISNIQTESELFSFYHKSGNAGLVTKSGDLLNDQLYDHINFSEFGLFTVTKNKKSGVIDKNGKIIIPIAFERIFLNDGIFYVKPHDTRTRYKFDRTGKQL